MGKIKTTKKEIEENFNNIYCVGYCGLAHLLRYTDADYYTSGVYGWNADIYKIDYNTVIVTGYRPFGKSIDYEITEKYNEKAREIENKAQGYEKTKKQLEKLLNKFIKESEK